MKTFIGWTNIKKFITEVIKMYSNEPSFFSKKRVESGIAFFVAQGGMIVYFVHKLPAMEMTDLAMWAGIEFAVAGYIISSIQKEKKDAANSSGSSDQPLNS